MDDTALPPRTVGGRYRLIEPLGSGGMGTVWRAEDLVLGRQVAVKEVVFPHGVSAHDRETLRERTRREARLAARLDHPSAVTVYDVVEEDGQPWLVLELVEAQTLAEVVRAQGPLSPQRTAEVGLAVLGALQAAHARGIVHRDVKPSNVLISPPRDGAPGRVVLTDFGIATSPGDSSITSTGLLLGSPAYISPERARGQAPGPASDLWALGATLFTAVEGRPPYDKGEPLATLTAVVGGDQEPYVAAGPLVPVLDGLLEPDPERRMDAATASALLQRVAAGTPATVVTPRPQPLAATRSERTTALPVGDAVVPEPVAAPVPAPAPTPVPPRRTPPPPASRPAAPRRRRQAPLVVAGLAGLLALGGGAAALLSGGDGSGATTAAAREGAAATSGPTPGSEPSPPAAAQPSVGPPAESPTGPTTQATTAPTTEPTPEPSSEPSQPVEESPQAESPAPEATEAPSPEAPQGQSAAGTYRSPQGWTAAVPAGWTRTDRSGEVQFRDRQTGRTLRVETGQGRPDAVEDRRAAARGFSSRYPSYEEIAIREADYRGYPAADWEFTFTARDGTELHVLNRVFVAGGRGHSLWFQTRAADFDAARPVFDQITAGFQPAGGQA